MYVGWNDKTFEHFDNVSINMLPMFVYLTSIDADPTEYFEKVYKDFIKKMEVKDTPALKTWCEEQYVHYYECNH